MDFTYKDITIGAVIIGWVGSAVTLWTTFKNKIKRNSDEITELKNIMYNNKHQFNFVSEKKFDDHKTYMFRKLDKIVNTLDNIEDKSHETSISIAQIMVKLEIKPDSVLIEERRDKKRDK